MKKYPARSRRKGSGKRVVSLLLLLAMVVSLIGPSIPAASAASAAEPVEVVMTKIAATTTKITVKTEPAATGLTQANFKLYHADKDSELHASHGTEISITDVSDKGEGVYEITTALRNDNGTQLLAIVSDDYTADDLALTSHNIIPLPVSYEGAENYYTLSEKTAIVVEDKNDEAVMNVATQLAEVLRASTGYSVAIVNETEAESGDYENNIVFTLIADNETLATVGGTALTQDKLNEAAIEDAENGKGIIDTVAEEAYVLNVTTDGIEVKAYDAEGLFRASASIRQLFPAEIESKDQVDNVEWSIACANIVDYPRYGYRGQQFDLARHFQSVEWIKKQIDTMSLYKMSVLKLHLTDEQGWRIAFDGYDELTAFAGMTKTEQPWGRSTAVPGYPDEQAYPGSVNFGQSGYYTQDEFKEIVAYAQAHYMEVVPEIEFPGHSVSQLASLPELSSAWSGGAMELYPNGFFAYGSDGSRFVNDPNQNAFTAAYIDAIIQQLAEISPSKYIHMGGDEVQKMSQPDFDNVADYILSAINDQDKFSIQWVQDNANVADYSAPDVIQNWKRSSNSWQYIKNVVEKGSYILASLSDHTYFDHPADLTMPVGMNWTKSSAVWNGRSVNVTTPYAYAWDPAQAAMESDGNGNWTDTGYEDRIIGVEGEMWTEVIGSETIYEAMLYPRLLGLAEVAWSPKNMDRSVGFNDQADVEAYYWVNHKERLAPQGERLYLMDIDFMNDPDVWPVKEITRDEYKTVTKTTTVGTAVSGQFHFEALDEENPAIMTLAADPTQGTVSINEETGEWTYTPAAGFIGADGFTVAFSTPGYGIANGLHSGNVTENGGVVSTNGNTEDYIGFAQVHINVERAANDTEDHEVQVTFLNASKTNLSFKLEPAVPGMTVKDGQTYYTITAEDADGNVIEEIPVRYGGTYDNGSSYLLVTGARPSGKEYTLTIKKDGYTFNTVTFQNNTDNDAYTMSFDDNYASTEFGAGKYGDAPYTGHVPDSAVVTAGVQIGIPTNVNGLQAAGYSLKEWNTQADGKGTSYQPGDTTFIMPDHDVTLYAIWEKTPAKLIRVIYDANGADAGKAPVEPYSPFVEGVAVEAMTNLWNLQKSGCKFNGWNTKADGTGTHYDVGATVLVPSTDLTLYAEWVVVTGNNVTYNPNGATGGTAPVDTTAYNAGGRRPVTIANVKDNSANLRRDGYEFAGWNTAADGSGTAYAAGDTFTVTENTTLYAQWTGDGVAAKSEKDLGLYFFYGQSAETLPWDRLTTINYAFYKVDPVTHKAVPGLCNDPLYFPQFQKMCAEYPDVNVVISVGGWADSGYFSDMAATKEDRTVFIESCVQILKENPWLAGIDLDWEYPGIARDPYDLDGGCNVLEPGVDCANYLLLLQEMRAAFEQEWPGEHKILTVCAAGNIKDLDVQDLVAISNEVDRINIMTYDLHGGYWDKYAQHHSNVNAVAADGYRSSVTNVIEYFNNAGVDPQKVNIGSPFYSKNWDIVVDIDNVEDALGAPAKNAAWGASYDLDDPDCVYYYDEEAQAPYVWKKSTNQFFSIEDERSMQAKVDYINENNLGGIIVWDQSGDDPSADWPFLTLLSTGLDLAKDKYTVTYNENFDSANTPSAVSVSTHAPDASAHSEGTNVTVLGNEGGMQIGTFHFAGWNTAADGSGTTYQAGDKFVMPSADVTLYAIWEKGAPEYCTVTYDANGATAGEAPSEPYSPFMEGQAVNTMTNLWNLQRSGYSFNGWNTKADGTGTHYAVGAKLLVPSGGIVLYAEWTQLTGNANNVTYNPNGATGGMAPVDTTTYNSGRRPVTTAAVKDNTSHLWKAGYEFAGWNTEADGSGTAYAAGDTFTVTANTTLYAQWTGDGVVEKTEKDLGVYFFNGSSVEALPWDRLTTINYAFWKVDPDTHEAVPGLGNDARYFPEFEKMHEQYPDVNIVISVGGWADSGYFSDMAATKEDRTVFIESCVQALKDHPWLAGIDLDWEYPGIARDPYDMDGGCNVLEPGVDCVNYLLLLQEMRAAFEKEWPNEHKILTVCAAGNIKDLDTQDLYEISLVVDRINFMTYDLHGIYWDKRALHHSNVYPSASDQGRSSAQIVVEYAFNSGMDPQKINIGSPFYTKGWGGVQATSAAEALGAPSDGSRASRLNKDDPTWEFYYDEVAEEGYWWHQDTDTSGTFLSAENERSLQAKIDFINNMNLGGIIVWSTSGDSASEDWPLLTQISSGMEITAKKAAVRYETNDGSSSYVIRVDLGETAVKPEEPTRDGYTFGGWYSDEDLTTAYDFNTPVTADITLYAKWTEVTTAPIGPTGPATPPTTTETKTNEDGSVTTTVTNNLTGEVTVTTELVDGGKIEKVTNPDKDVAITVTDKDGEVLAEVEIPAEIPASETRFVDVPIGHWADEAIHNMAVLGVVNGIGNNLYDLNGNMTRGALATVLSRLSNGQKGLDSSFADVADGQWYADGIAWAAKTGVVTGYSETEFGPNDPITREQLAVMLCRYARLLGIDITADTAALNGFTDGSSTHDWATDSIAWCVANGILQGKGNATLAPTATATRAEVALMLQRFINLMK